jgi:hypothetical protein
MKCITYSQNNPYEYKKFKIRSAILESIYRKPFSCSIADNKIDNARLRFRFREAIDDAHAICSDNMNSRDCYMAWEEVDELEDSMMRIGMEVFSDNNMRYGSLMRRNFKNRWNIKNIEDHHVIPYEFRNHPVIRYVGYDIHSSDNIIMMPRILTPNLRENRLTHNGGHKKYNKYVGNVLNSIDALDEPDPEFRKFVDFLKIGCRFRPQDIPWS